MHHGRCLCYVILNIYYPRAEVNSGYIRDRFMRTPVTDALQRLVWGVHINSITLTTEHRHFILKYNITKYWTPIMFPIQIYTLTLTSI